MSRYDIQQKIMDSKVMIIGTGTIGASMVMNLATYGISKFILVDDDVVDKSNLRRQPHFDFSDIGVYKVDALKKKIKFRNENTVVVGLKEKIKSYHRLLDISNIYPDIDIIIFAGDSGNMQRIIKNDKATLEYSLTRLADEKNIPISFTGGYVGHTGRIFPLYIPGKSHKLQCVLKQITQEESSYEGYEPLGNNNFILSSTTEMAGNVANVASFEIIKYLSSVMPIYLINKVMYLEYSSYQADVLECAVTTCNCSMQLV
ncbi:ThiF family adenylyltransferase [Peribacillus sp. SCS-26]|uniref:ThiF family adenylyltransferase n=1 Tax=Paraperibacillus marinus TaxID=3115295 RepID=UPI00390604BA